MALKQAEELWKEKIVIFGYGLLGTVPVWCSEKGESWMDRKEILDTALREMREDMLAQRRKTCSEREERLYLETDELAGKTWDILRKRLSGEERQTVESYFLKINVLAQDEGEYLYIRGIKDGIKLMKELEIL